MCTLNYVWTRDGDFDTLPRLVHVRRDATRWLCAVGALYVAIVGAVSDECVDSRSDFQRSREHPTAVRLPHIFKTKGSIIGISSITGHLGIPSRTAYSASKHAMNGLLEALRTEVMTRGVHVLVVAPGFTQSNIRKVSLNADGQVHGESPMDENKMMTSEAVAKAILKATKGRKRDLVLTVEPG